MPGSPHVPAMAGAQASVHQLPLGTYCGLWVLGRTELGVLKFKFIVAATDCLENLIESHLDRESLRYVLALLIKSSRLIRGCTGSGETDSN